MDGKPNRRNKAAFSNSSGLVWKLPYERPVQFPYHQRSRFEIFKVCSTCNKNVLTNSIPALKV